MRDGQPAAERVNRPVRLTIRIDFGNGSRVGPGKIRLLELISAHGSISAAGRVMGMSYRRAWVLVDDLNRCFREPLVSTQMGGAGGGGAALTRAGQEVLACYRAIESESYTAAASAIDTLVQLTAAECADRCRERDRGDGGPPSG